MKYNFPKLSFVLSLLFFIFSLALFAFFYWQIEANNMQATVAWQKWAMEAKRRNDLKFVEEAIAKTADKREELDSHFAEASDAVPFLDMIEQTGRGVGTDTHVVGVDLPKDTSALVVRAESGGNFESIYKFLKLIENSPYELEWKTLDINSVGTEASKWSATFEIKLLSFIK